MSIESQFFVADPEELLLCFPDWLDVASKPVEQEFANLQTGEKVTRRCWEPAKKQKKRPPYDVRKLPKLESATFGGITPDELRLLIALISDLTDEAAAAELDRPVLLDPHVSLDERGMYLLATSFVRQLASLSDKVIASTAKVWSRRCRHIPVDFANAFVTEIQKLAKSACNGSKGLYFYWGI